MLNVIHQFETSTVLFFVTVCFVAGFIKGIVGFAMPMIILGCSAALGMPLLGLAVLIMPTLVTNIYQVSLFGKAELVKSIRDFRFFLFACLIGLFVGANLFAAANLNILIAGICAVVLLLSLLQLVNIRAPKRANSRALSGISGAITGLLGGGTGIWGPTTVLYLTSIGTSKKRQILVQGLTFALSSFFLLFAHLYTGVFNKDTGILSTFMVLPAMIGMIFGVGIQRYLNQDKFRVVTLILLCIGGVYLIYRSANVF